MMRPANGEESTSTETPHAAMSWTACFDDGCLVHLSDKQGANWFSRQATLRQPQRKGKKLRWGEPVEEPKIHHEVGTFVVQLQEEMLRMADEIGRLKQENREMKKRVAMAEEAVRRGGIENCRRAYEKLELQPRVRRVAEEVAKMAKAIDDDKEFAEFIGVTVEGKEVGEDGRPTNGDGATKANDAVSSWD